MKLNKTKKNKIASKMLEELENIDQRKEGKKGRRLTQKQHDSMSKKAVLKGLEKLT